MARAGRKRTLQREMAAKEHVAHWNMSGSASEAPRNEPGSPRTSRLFSLKDASILCWALFIIFVAAPSVLLIKQNIPKENVLQQVPERNFIFFYSMGRMLNERPATKLYNFELQEKTANGVHRLDKGNQYAPNPYPPFVAVFFRPFARMPFFAAYVLWLAISCLLYIAGLRIAARQFFPDDPVRRSLVFPLALSFFPFLWIMNGGQLAAIAFFPSRSPCAKKIADISFAADSRSLCACTNPACCCSFCPC